MVEKRARPYDAWNTAIVSPIEQDLATQSDSPDPVPGSKASKKSGPAEGPGEEVENVSKVASKRSQHPVISSSRRIS